jgi:hypothetical protein
MEMHRMPGISQARRGAWCLPTVAIASVAFLVAGCGGAHKGAVATRTSPSAALSLPAPSAVSTPANASPSETTAGSSAVVQARADATAACQAWLSATTAIDQPSMSVAQDNAARLATLAAGLDPAWGGLAQAMAGYNKLPITGSTTANHREAAGYWKTITSSCASLGITIPG